MWMLLAALASAGIPEDLATAADTDLPTSVRQQAFDRAAQPGSAPTLMRIADDTQTPKPQRWVAVRALGPIKDDEARSALLHFLASEDASARIAALGALADRGDLSLSAHVAARLSDPALLVRAAAADALGRLKDPATLGDLDRAVQDPTNHYRGASLWFRQHLVEAIASIGTEAAVPPLARALDDTDTNVASAAMSGLEAIAGFSYGEGRSPEQEKAAWKRWAGR